MRISDWSSDVCSSDLKPHSARSGGSGSLTSGQQAEFVLTFLRKSAGNEFVSGAQPLAIPLERKAPGLDHRDPACARQILCRGDARLVGQGEEEIVLDLEMNMALGRVPGEVENLDHFVVDLRDYMIAHLHIERAD